MKYFFYIKRFFDVPAIEKKLLIKGIALTFILKLIIQIFPVKYYIFLIKTKPKFLIEKNGKLTTLCMARKTMRRIIRFVPWHCNCLVKSMTLKLLLNSIGIENSISFTLTKLHPQLLIAHAFIKINCLTHNRTSGNCSNALTIL